MLIILEGPDGVGKTTLARQLTDIIHDVHPRSTVTTIHRGRPTRHPLDEYLTPLLSYEPGSNSHLILDRWHIGEYVYPRLTFRATQLDAEVWWYLNQYVRRLGGILVLCGDSEENVAAEYARRDTTHPIEKIELFGRATKLFHEAVDAASLPQVTYDWSDPFRIDPVNIVRTAGIRASHAGELDEYVTYVGRQSPRYLLLGDVRHGLDLTREASTVLRDRRPAFVPYAATSGHWLLSALLSQPQLADVTALANACDVDDVFGLWSQLGKPKVATLGNNAHRVVSRIGDIPHGRVPHPQFSRRFHHHDQASYGAALAAALRNQEDHSKWRGSSQDATAVRSTAKSSTTSADAAESAAHATV